MKFTKGGATKKRLAIFGREAERYFRYITLILFWWLKTYAAEYNDRDLPFSAFPLANAEMEFCMSFADIIYTTLNIQIRICLEDQKVSKPFYK